MQRVAYLSGSHEVIIRNTTHMNTKNTKNIMMVHPGRCGSSVTADLLGQNPNIHWDGEIYLHILQKWIKENTGKKHNKIIENPIESLKNSIDKVTKPYYGCEISPFNFNIMSESMEQFFNKSYHLNFTYFILLRRKNLLRLIVSSNTARQSAEWHSRHISPSRWFFNKIQLSSWRNIFSLPYYRFLINEIIFNKKKSPKFNEIKTPKPKKIIFDIPNYQLEKKINQLELEMQEMENILSGNKILHLNYEDDIEQDPKKAYLRICEFIGVKPTKVCVRYKKTNPFPLADIIENFDEIKAILHNTPYEWMLNS